MAAFCFIPCVCDGCALSFNSNPTWLSFSSDDIRVYLKGLGLVVCTSDFLAKPPNPRDGVRRITVSASLVGGWQSASETWTLFKCLCLAVFNECMWSKVLSLNNLKSPCESPQYSSCNVMIKSVHLHWKPCQHRVRVRKRSQTGCVKNYPFTAFLMSALSQNDMQFIPGIFFKPFSLIPRCKSPPALARLSVSQPLEQQDRQTDTQTGAQRTIQAIV